MTRNKEISIIRLALLLMPMTLGIITDAYIQHDDDGPYDQRIHHSNENEIEDHHDPSYRYEYQVNSPHTGDYKTQHEERIGDTVRGHYSLIEPDGSRRIVEYTADPVHGFKAVVKREPPSVHLHHTQMYPEPSPIPKPLPHTRSIPTKSTDYSAPKYPKKLFYLAQPPYPVPTPTTTAKPQSTHNKYYPFFRFHGWPFSFH